MVGLFAAFENWLWVGIVSGFYALLGVPGILGLAAAPGAACDVRRRPDDPRRPHPAHLLFSTSLGTRQLGG